MSKEPIPQLESIVVEAYQQTRRGGRILKLGKSYDKAHKPELDAMRREYSLYLWSNGLTMSDITLLSWITTHKTNGNQQMAGYIVSYYVQLLNKI